MRSTRESSIAPLRLANSYEKIEIFRPSRDHEVRTDPVPQNTFLVVVTTLQLLVFMYLRFKRQNFRVFNDPKETLLWTKLPKAPLIFL